MIQNKAIGRKGRDTDSGERILVLIYDLLCWGTCDQEWYESKRSTASDIIFNHSLWLFPKQE